MVNVVGKPHGFCGVPSTQKHPVLACLTMASWLKVTIEKPLEVSFHCELYQLLNGWCDDPTNQHNGGDSPPRTGLRPHHPLVSWRNWIFSLVNNCHVFSESGSWKWFWRRLLCTWWKFSEMHHPFHVPNGNSLKFPQWNWVAHILLKKHFTGGYGWYLPWVLIRYTLWFHSCSKILYYVNATRELFMIIPKD